MGGALSPSPSLSLSSPISHARGRSPPADAANWQEAVDPSSDRSYFYNVATQETTWRDPRAPVERRVVIEVVAPAEPPRSPPTQQQQSPQQQQQQSPPPPSPQLAVAPATPSAGAVASPSPSAGATPLSLEEEKDKRREEDPFGAPSLTRASSLKRTPSRR